MIAFMGLYIFFNIIVVTVWVLNSRRIILEPEVNLHQCAAVSLCCYYVKRTDLKGKMLSIFKSIPTHMVILTLLKILFLKKRYSCSSIGVASLYRDGTVFEFTSHF